MRNVSYPQACADCLGVERCVMNCICPGCRPADVQQWNQLAPIMRELSTLDIGWNWSTNSDGQCSITEIYAGDGTFLEVMFTGMFEVWEDVPHVELEKIWEGVSSDECGTFVVGRASRVLSRGN